MAPEMVIMLNQKKPQPGDMYGDDQFNAAGTGALASPFVPLEERVLTQQMRARGYDLTVDWWSLGVTLYKLMTGTRPFCKDEFSQYVEMSAELQGVVRENAHILEFRRMFQVVEYPAHVSSEAVAFMRGLMDVEPTTRLGSGRQGLREIKKHPFFKGIDWDRLEQKQVTLWVAPLSQARSLHA